MKNNVDDHFVKMGTQKGKLQQLLQNVFYISLLLMSVIRK